MREGTVELLKAKLSLDVRNVNTLYTTRRGGFSTSSFQGLNLAEHVNDDLETVLKNRQLLRNALDGYPKISWMNQTHSTDVAFLENMDDVEDITDADAQVTTLKNVALAVLTADCLPVLITSDTGSIVACAHAGWRGLSGGIIADTIEAMDIAPERLVVWLGPCISQENFEVGDLVRTEFVEQNHDYSLFFMPSGKYDNKYFASLQDIAIFQLKQLGVRNISYDKTCTYNDSERFYSYRRDYLTGRTASLIWRV